MPSAGKFAAANASDQLVVPEAVRQFSEASAKAVPFQYWLSESRRIETSTACTEPPPVSDAVPAIGAPAFHVDVP